MLIEVIAAGVVGMALLWLVLQPLVSPASGPTVDLDPLSPEETPHGQALIALKEIEFDRATGKLSDEDYAALNARYSSIAIATLESSESPPALRCLAHGARNEPDALFCPECGAGLVTANDKCAACRTGAPMGAAFCPGCGVAFRR